MRNQSINKRLQEVKTAGKLSLFARIAWGRDLRKDTIRELQMDDKRLTEKEKE